MRHNIFRSWRPKRKPSTCVLYPDDPSHKMNRAFCTSITLRPSAKLNITQLLFYSSSDKYYKLSAYSEQKSTRTWIVLRNLALVIIMLQVLFEYQVNKRHDDVPRLSRTRKRFSSSDLSSCICSGSTDQWKPDKNTTNLTIFLLKMIQIFKLCSKKIISFS